MTRLLGAILMTAVACPALAQNAPSQDSANHAVYAKSQDIKWEDIEGGGKIAILHVDPKTKATDLMIRAPKNAHVPRHWHTANETITILSGTFVLGHDGGGDPVELNPGSYAYMPAKMIHQAWIKGDTDAQYFITVDGPWDINWVEGPMKATQ